MSFKPSESSAFRVLSSQFRVLSIIKKIRRSKAINWNNRSKSFLEILLLLVCTTVFIYARFGDTFFQFGSQKVVMAWGDGLKTYTNTIYHIRHDSTYSFFEGMNYPFREHIMAATELPGLANALRFIHQNIYEFSDAQIVDSIHLLLMVSLLLCALFLWLIFKRLGIPFWYGIPVAIGLTFLAPQTMRLNGHMGLSIAFVIPMMFYLLLRYEEEKNWKWILWIAAALFISAQFHFYFFGILAGVVFLYMLVKFPFQLSRLFHLSIMLLPPLLFYYFWMVAGDPVTDRSPKPSGFLHYKASLESIFTNIQLPFFQWLDLHFFEIGKAEFEGRAYVGIVGGLFCLFVLVKGLWLGLSKLSNLINLRDLVNFFQSRYLKLRFTKSSRFSKSNGGERTELRQRFLHTILFSSILLALFSIGFPFIIPQFEFLLDYAGPLRQFRSIGRFAWVFYFALNIFAFTYLYFAILKLNKPIFKTISFTLIISILAHDSFEFAYSKEFKLYEGFHFKEGEEFTTLPGVHYQMYQAILPIPYFNVGSNNFAKNEKGFSSHVSFIMSAQTGLPNIGAMLTRTSRSQTFKQWQLLGQPYTEPSIFKEYPSKKPILLIWWKKTTPEETARYEHLKKGAKFLYEEGNMELYELPLKTFDNRISDVIDHVLDELEDENLFEHDPFLSTDSLKTFAFVDFDENLSKNPYLGKGSFKGVTTDSAIIFSDQLPNQQAGKPYEISLWADFGTDRFGLSLAGILQEIAPNGKILQQKKWYLGRQLLTCDDT